MGGVEIQLLHHSLILVSSLGLHSVGERGNFFYHTQCIIWAGSTLRNENRGKDIEITFAEIIITVEKKKKWV